MILTQDLLKETLNKLIADKDITVTYLNSIREVISKENKENPKATCVAIREKGDELASDYIENMVKPMLNEGLSQLTSKEVYVALKTEEVDAPECKFIHMVYFSDKV